MTQTVIELTDTNKILQALTELMDNDNSNELPLINFNKLQPLHVKLTGENFQKSLTASVMQGLLDFQEGIYRSYCHLQYGSTNLRHLKEYEKKQLEIIVIIDFGCTDLLVDLKEIFNSFKELLTDMESKHKLIAISAICLTVLSGYGIANYKDYALEIAEKNKELELKQIENNKEIELKKIESDNLLKSQENMIKSFEKGQESDDKTDTEEQGKQTTENITSQLQLINPPSDEIARVIETVRNEYQEVEVVTDIVDDSVRKFLHSTIEADRVEYNHVFNATGTMVKKMTDKPRRTSTEIILSV